MYVVTTSGASSPTRTPCQGCDLNSSPSSVQSGSVFLSCSAMGTPLVSPFAASQPAKPQAAKHTLLRVAHQDLGARDAGERFKAAGEDAVGQLPGRTEITIAR